VRSPGYLHFYKDRKAAQDAILRNRDPSRSVDSSALVINLSKVNSFTIPDKKNKDANCVDLDLGHESIRMRYVTASRACWCGLHVVLIVCIAGVVEWRITVPAAPCRFDHLSCSFADPDSWTTTRP
jgi:hypothetical protein